MTYTSLSAELDVRSSQLKARHSEQLAAGSEAAIAKVKAEAAELVHMHVITRSE